MWFILQNIEDSSLVILGYLLFLLATSKLMDDIQEFNDSMIFEVFYSLLGCENFRTLKIHHWFTLATSQNMQRFTHILMCFAL